MPRPVDQRQALAAGVDDRTEVGTRTAHGVGHPGLAHRAVHRNHARGLRIRIDAEHVGAHLRQEVGHDEIGGAVGQVENELHLVPGAPAQPEGLDDVRRVQLDRAGREVDVADFACGDAAELLTVVHALDTALIALGEIDAPLVEEADHDGLRIVRAEPDREAGPVAAHAHVVLRHRHGGQLQVVDVDADRVAPHHQGTLEHPGHPAGVTRGGDERALLEPRGPRLGQAHRQLRADVDVGDALHALGAEQRSGATRTPTQWRR